MGLIGFSGPEWLRNINCNSNAIAAVYASALDRVVASRSGSDRQRIRLGRNGKPPRGPITGFKGTPDGIADEFLNDPFHRSRPKSFVDTLTNEKFKSRF